MMKKYILMNVFLFTLQLALFAQEESRFGFGVYGGANMQNINGTNEAGQTLKNTLVPKLVAGINLSYLIAPEIHLQAGLQYIGKGTKGEVQYEDNNGQRTITRTLNLHYIELPIHFIYKPQVGSGHLILGFGPYFGYCLGGNAVLNGTPAVEETKITFTKTVATDVKNNLSYFKPLDIGANFMVGYAFQNGINVLLNTQLGLININANNGSDLSNKNTGFGLTLGYQF